MLLTESDPRFYIAESTIPGAGRGLFANSPLRTGEELWVVGVYILPDSVVDDCTRFADAYKIRVGDRLLIPFGYAAVINHSRSPNLEKVITGDTVRLRVVRPIERDEELFFRYSAYACERFRLDE